jgi:hypothetical protein
MFSPSGPTLGQTAGLLLQELNVANCVLAMAWMKASWSKQGRGVSSLSPLAPWGDGATVAGAVQEPKGTGLKGSVASGADVHFLEIGPIDQFGGVIRTVADHAGVREGKDLIPLRWQGGDSESSSTGVSIVSSARTSAGEGVDCSARCETPAVSRPAIQTAG